MEKQLLGWDVQTIYQMFASFRSLSFSTDSRLREEDDDDEVWEELLSNHYQETADETKWVTLTVNKDWSS